MELRSYLAILWRRKWLVVVTTMVTVSIVAIGTYWLTPTYMASTTLRIPTARRGSVDWLDYDVYYAERLLNTYAEIATSRSVLDELVQTLELGRPPEIEAEALANTELLRITVKDPQPAIAKVAADVVADILIRRSRELEANDTASVKVIIGERLEQLEEELDQARAEYDSLVAQFAEDSASVLAARSALDSKEAAYTTLLEQYELARVRDSINASALFVVEAAETPLAPSQPHKALYVALGALVGLLGGLGLAFLFDNLDSTLYTARQVEDVMLFGATGRGGGDLEAMATAYNPVAGTLHPAHEAVLPPGRVQILGSIPLVKRRWRGGLLNGNSPEGEAFRHLRTKILAADQGTSPRSFLVTSAEPGEGKSTVAASLAYNMAQSGRLVLVMDCDLRRPTLHQIFDLPNQIGLSNVLWGEATFEQAVQQSQVPTLCVLTSGPLPADPAGWLGRDAMAELIFKATQLFNLVFLDTPSLLAVSDAAVLAPRVDGAVLVVGLAKVQREAVLVACRQLHDVGARSISVVMNRTRQNGLFAYYR
jgi:non-specific protein-tyrosine kinase